MQTAAEFYEGMMQVIDGWIYWGVQGACREMGLKDVKVTGSLLRDTRVKTHKTLGEYAVREIYAQVRLRYMEEEVEASLRIPAPLEGYFAARGFDDACGWWSEDEYGWHINNGVEQFINEWVESPVGGYNAGVMGWVDEVAKNLGI